MKVLYKRIEKCKECPYFRIGKWYEESRVYPICAYCDEVIEEEEKIPKWCPLPDEEYLYEEEEG